MSRNSIALVTIVIDLVTAAMALVTDAIALVTAIRFWIQVIIFRYWMYYVSRLSMQWKDNWGFIKINYGNKMIVLFMSWCLWYGDITKFFLILWLTYLLFYQHFMILYKVMRLTLFNILCTMISVIMSYNKWFVFIILRNTYYLETWSTLNL